MQETVFNQLFQLATTHKRTYSVFPISSTWDAPLGITKAMCLLLNLY